MNVVEKLTAVERAIAENRLDDATAELAALARELLDGVPRPLELAHAHWLASAIALREGDERAFVMLSRSAVAGLRMAGEDELARSAIASRTELLEQLVDLQDVQTRGDAGLMDVLDRQCARLYDIAAKDGWRDERWAAVNRQRALLPALVALVEATTGQPAALARIIDELELDAVESVLLATLAPLSHIGAPVTANRLARMTFGDSRGHDEALLRLRDDGRLARGRALVAAERGELALAPELLARLYAPR
jgi:hypothetical protein